MTNLDRDRKTVEGPSLSLRNSEKMLGPVSRGQDEVAHGVDLLVHVEDLGLVGLQHLHRVKSSRPQLVEKLLDVFR